MKSDTETSTSRRRGDLDRQAIVDAAVKLADRAGVERLSMRNLADELGYRVMALYNHVANKDEVLNLMVDQVAMKVDRRNPDLAPLAAVRAIAMSARRALIEHPWAADLWVRHMPGPARVQMMEDLLAALADSNLSPDVAHHGFHAVTNHVIGYTLQEVGMVAGMEAHGDPANPDEMDDLARSFIGDLDPEAFHHTIIHVHQHLNGETSSSFEFVLDLILDGLVRVDASLRPEAD